MENTNQRAKGNMLQNEHGNIEENKGTNLNNETVKQQTENNHKDDANSNSNILKNENQSTEEKK